MASQNDSDVFSIRIVSLDYYMSPPIPDLDFCSSSFLGTKVEEVPVIRIYGATLAGQKTCMHVHRVLPYFYIPLPEDLLQSPEEGQAFIHTLSGAMEKALKHKSISTSKRKHVHGCSLVRAKKLYGYHSSEELFVKIFLYYPHDISHVATLLRDGSILGKSFQPYESHIPYLLQFLVDYNLNGMSHLHTSKVKFRSPLTYCYNAASLRNKNYDMPPTLSSSTCEKTKIWLSSTVPSSAVWPDSTGWLDSTDSKCINLIRRQSICQLEVDASAEDIINEKFKIYTSLSQTRFDVRMVQSLVPIWEEEYERSGIQEATKQDDPNKPHADRVLKSFIHGLNYDKTLYELCIETCNSFPSKIHVGGNEKLVKYMKSLKDISTKFELMGSQQHTNSRDVCLVGGEEENRTEETSSSQSSMRDLKCLDTEALGLLSWLASSQAEEEMDTGDELLHEAILSPLLPGKSFSVALEMAHRDYEHASQLECQDILDSVEDILKSKRSKEQASTSRDLILNSVECILKSEGSKEQALSSSRDLVDAVSSGVAIPQVDGSFDDSWKSPKKVITSEANMSFGEEKAVAQSGGMGLSAGCKNKGKNLWGNLPISVCGSQYETSDSFCVVSSTCAEMINDGSYNPPFYKKEGNQYDDFKNEIGAENYSGKSGKTSGLCSTRDLMRKKRYLRVEQAESEVQKTEDIVHGRTPTTSVSEDLQLPVEEPSIEQSVTHKKIQGSIASSTIASSDFQGTECFEHQSSVCHTVQKAFSSLCTGKVQSNTAPSETIGFKQGYDLNEQMKISKAALKIEAGDMPILETVSMKSFESSEVKIVGSGSPPNIRRCQSNHNENSTGNVALKSHRNKNRNSENVANKLASTPEDGIAHKVLLPEMSHRNCQQSTCLFDENSRDFCKEKKFEEFIEMAFINRPPSNDHIHCPEESLPADQANGNIDKRQGMENILPFFPRVSQDKNSHDENAFFSQDSAFGIPTHFQNDGSVLYLLTHAQSPPTFSTVNDWLSGEKQHYLLVTGASKEGLDSYCGVLNEGISCQTSPSPTAVRGSQFDSSQSNKESCSPETENCHPNIVHISCEPKLDNIPAKEKVVNEDLHDLSQISGPEKYKNSNPTPISQIGFRDPASVGVGQQLTLISMEIQAETRGDLRSDPKIDAINVLSLVVREDTSNMCQSYILLRVIDEKLGEKNGNGVFDCNLFLFTEEKLLLECFVEIISYFDPDVLMGWEIQGGSLGYLAERASYLGMKLLKKLSRTPFHDMRDKCEDLGYSNLSGMHPGVIITETVIENSIIEDDWGRTHASGLHVGGRIVLNIWRLMRAELKLNMYTAEAVAEVVLRQKIPLFSDRKLNQWYSSGIRRARDKCIGYAMERTMLNFKIMDQLDMINRTSELARIFGIDFFSVISRGSQFRVESMLLRLAHTQNYLAISPGYQQVASQPAMECLPLVMEPESGFYVDPVVVLDFQSLYPSMIIAYNICFCTCLGNAISSRANVLGVSSYSPDVQILKDLREKLLLTPNGVMYVPPEVRKGILPRLLEEILSTRIMVKQAMKKLKSSQLVLHRILNARQLALKLISNVTYGYTAAGFSGRMPCAEIADSIVQCGRMTLETAISYVNQHEEWKAKVIYGDTDSMFVLLKGRSKEEAFIIGNQIASAITTMNPEPVTLKLEKVYQPCFLLTKKRYVGYSYESPEQEKPIFDAKGIETIRRDTCPVVAKTLERSIRLIFESNDLSEVKSYLKRQWTRILAGKISLKDFVFAKEVRLGTYSSRSSSLPPAAIVAKKAMEIDPRAEPCYGERVPYVVVHGEPGSRLMDMVVNPFDLLDLNSPYRLNDLYYINKQMIPALQRVFGLLGADLNRWFSAIPRPTRPMLAKRHTPMSYAWSFQEDDSDSSTVSKKPNAKRMRIDTYYSSKHCTVCDSLLQSSEHFCVKCSRKEALVAATVIGKTSKKEREMLHLAEICRHCGGGDWIVESGVKCISLSCAVLYERMKVQKELQALFSFATSSGFYPPCDAELF